MTRSSSWLVAAGCCAAVAFGAAGAQTATGAVNEIAHAIAIQPDGKIVVGGDYNASFGSGFAVARYTSAGKRDASFGAGGITLINPGRWGSASAYGVALQPDGKIVAAGASTADARIGSPSPRVFMLVRYTKTGALDAGFGSGGGVLTALGGGGAGAHAVAVQRDGKIVAAGGSGPSCPGTPCQSAFALVRYTTSGQLDAGFGFGGKVLTGLGGSDGASAVAVQPDG
ncbi:MAG: delta-60 repeat domain-containing protein, partial [Verrucomicrobiota bacterium]